MLMSGEGTGLLRLHSTYRHDLKIYSSDEGRVQVRLLHMISGGGFNQSICSVCAGRFSDVNHKTAQWI